MEKALTGGWRGGGLGGAATASKGPLRFWPQVCDAAVEPRGQGWLEPSTMGSLG